MQQSQRQIICPACGVQLAGAGNLSDCVIRCGRCHARFRLTPKSNITEDAVASWLQEGRGASDVERDMIDIDEMFQQIEPPHSGGTHVMDAIEQPMRTVKTDRAGVLLEFPVGRLNEIPFRCSMPRKCLQCGSRTHLKAHVIVYSTNLRDAISLEAEHSAGSMVMAEEAFHGATGLDMLRMLPRVPNVPHPGDLPMPYWLCDMCSGAGVLSAQLNVNSATGKGWCRLLFRSSRRAMEFMAASGAGSTKDYEDLAKRVSAAGENAWETLSEAAQNRLRQWFRLNDGESFIAYVPDRDRMRTEDGMAGIVLTSHRLVYHTQVRHREAGIKDRIEIEYAMAGVRGVVEIKTPHWEVKRMSIDREGADRFRRGLSAGKFNAAWK